VRKLRSLQNRCLKQTARKSNAVLVVAFALMLIAGFSANAQLSGPYSIGAGQTYTTLRAFATALNNSGVSGPVVATVLPGTYNGSVSFNAITGASPTNTITIRGSNVNSCIIEAATNSSNTYVIRLYGTDYMRIENLTINALGTTYGYGVWLTRQADYNELTDCKINVSPTSSSSYSIGVLASGSSYSSSGNNANHNTIEGNEVTGGNYGILLRGNGSTSNCVGNDIIDNKITGWYYYGVYLYYEGNCDLIGNTITDRGASAYYRNYGIYRRYNRTGCVTRGNYIHARYYGLYSYYENQDNSVRASIDNNMIIVENSSYYTYGIYCRYANKMDISFNSIKLRSTTSSYSDYGIYTYVSSTYRDVNIRNNIIYYDCPYSKYPYFLYLNSTSTTYYPNIRNNAYYSTNGRQRWYHSGTYYSLSSLQSSRPSHHQNSLYANPQFEGSYDLHSYSQSLNNAGIPVSGITQDFDGETRHATTPNIGCDEYTLYPLDVGVTGVLGPAPRCGMGATESLVLTVRNYGTSVVNVSITPITFHVTVTGPINQTITGTVSAGLIFPGSTISFVVPGNLDMSIPGVYTVNAYTSMAGDGGSANDAMDPAFLTADNTITAFPYSEDFEAGTGLFRSESITGVDDWEYGTPRYSGSYTINTANSGTQAWATNLTGYYSDYADAGLMAPCLDFSTLSAPVLQFYASFATESAYDGWVVDASSNGGASWSRLMPAFPSYNYYYGYSPHGAPQYSSTSMLSWRKYVFLLGAYAGMPQVKIRWRFGSDFMINSYPGLAVDDVAIGDFYQKDIEVTDVVYDNAKNYWARRVGADHMVHARIVNLGYELNPTIVDLTYKEGMNPSFMGDGVAETFIPSWNGSEAWVSFMVPHMPMNTGPMTMYVRSFYPGDQDISNDAAKVTHIVQPPNVYGYEDFSTLTPPAFEKLWMVADLNGGETWVTEAAIGSGGSIGATYPGDVSTADDWLITPGAMLPGASSIALDFMYRSRTGDPQILEVAYGLTPDPAAMTVFATYANFTNTSFTPARDQYGISPSFVTAPTAQLYYIGFHVKSAAGMCPLDLDDLRLLDNPFPPPKIAYGNDPNYIDDATIPMKFTGVYKKTGLLTYTSEVVSSTGWYGDPEGDFLWDANCLAHWIDLYKSVPDPLTFLSSNPYSPPWARQRQTFTMNINASILPAGTHTTTLDLDAYLYNDVYSRGIRATNALFSIPVELTLSASGGPGPGGSPAKQTYASMSPGGNPWIFQDTQGNVFAVVNVTGGVIPSMTITSYPGQLPKHISRYRYVDHYWTIDATGTGWTTDIEFHYFDSEVLSGGVIDEWWLRGIRIPSGMGYWEDPIAKTMSMPNAFDNNVMVLNINDANYDGEIALAHDWNLIPEKEGTANIPSTFSLDQNYPNPFNPSTEIRFGLPSEEHVTLTVTNGLGKEVASIVNQVLPAGFHVFNFNPNNMPSGMYMYTLKAGNFIQTRTMVLSK
jgi:parallel beta-helix repeat protein